MQFLSQHKHIFPSRFTANQTAAHRRGLLMPALPKRERAHEQKFTEREGTQSGSHPAQNQAAHVNIWNSLEEEGNGVSISLFTLPVCY